MTNVIYKSPQSSCSCLECDKNNFGRENGIPTNLGLVDSNVNDYYECYNRKIFKQNFVPKNEDGSYFLNPYVVNDPERNAIDFGYIDNSGKDCPGKTYISMDPRLFDAKRGQRYALDAPPFDDTVKLKDVYDEKFLNYGKNYKTYSDIKAGNIVYYIDKSIQDAFYEPNFSEPAYEVGMIYQDPMGSIKPEYNRIPLIPQPNKATNISSDYSGYRSSFLDDSQQHREDLMALQSRKQNQSRWEPRWTGLNKNIGSIKPVPNPYSCV
jgi:hypothetical protein